MNRVALVASTSAVAAGIVSASIYLTRRRRRNNNLSDGKAKSAVNVIPMSEVAVHDKSDDAWLVVDGQVYDVTKFMDEHPGGKMLLLAFAGKDASDPWNAIGHSAVALRTQRQFYVGPLATLDASGLSGQMFRQPTARTAELTGGRRLDSPTASRKQDALWDPRVQGFLPARDPVGVEALNGTIFEPFARLQDMLPGLGFTGALREMLDTDVDLQAEMLKSGDPESLVGLSEDQLERAFGTVGYTIVAYWRGGTADFSAGISADARTGIKNATGSCAIEMEATSLPLFLSKPMLNVASRVGRPPMIDYSATVLYNWVRIDPNGPVSMSNVRCVHRLTGLIDEEWFFKTHVVIESESAHAVAAVINVMLATSLADMLTHLVALEEALWRVVRACMPIMYERAEGGIPNLSEHVFYHVLRPLIKTGKMIFEGDTECIDNEGNPLPRTLFGPSGAMSSLMPCMDAALGIKVSSEKMREMLKRFDPSMPVEHLRFLSDLRNGLTIRDRIMLARPAAGESSEQFDALARSYNQVISRVMDFRWQHWQYVKNFVIRPGNVSHAVGTGGTGFDFVQQHITDTEQARIRENSEGYSQVHSEPGEALPPLRVPTMSADARRHFDKEFWSVDGMHGLLAREPLAHPSVAEWARNVPKALREAFVDLWDIALRLPALCPADGPFYNVVSGHSSKFAALQDDRTVTTLPEVAREHLMTVLTHISAGCSANGRRKPPRCIERPLAVVSRSLGRPPHLEFAQVVLCNWRLKPLYVRNSATPEMEQGGANEEHKLQHQVVWRFLGMPDEDWYRCTHIKMHEEARDVVAAIRVGHVAMRDQSDAAAVRCMEGILAWFDKFCSFFDGFFDTKDSRTESVMYARLAPFLNECGQRTLSRQELACNVYVMGSSVLLPAVYAFFGVQLCPHFLSDDADTKEIAQVMRMTLAEGRVYMPFQHREFLELLEKPGMSMRQYCYRRFGVRSVHVGTLHQLETAYNDALNAMSRFMSRRLHLVSRFFPGLARTFGSANFEIEAVMHSKRLQLLKMRQRVYRVLQK